TSPSPPTATTPPPPNATPSAPAANAGRSGPVTVLGVVPVRRAVTEQVVVVVAVAVVAPADVGVLPALGGQDRRRRRRRGENRRGLDWGGRGGVRLHRGVVVRLFRSGICWGVHP